MIGDRLMQQSDTSQNRIQSFSGFPFVIAVCVSVCFSIGFVVSSPLGRGAAFDGCEIKLNEQINPNDAPVESLVRLPGIGPGKAGAIVAYREGFAERQGQGQAFQNCDDLQKVRGIGPKTAKNISELLKFE